MADAIHTRASIHDTAQPVEVWLNGKLVNLRGRVNFLGAVSVADNPALGTVDVTLGYTNPNTILSTGELALGNLMPVVLAGAAPTTAAGGIWPAANRAIYVPFRLHASAVVKRLFWYNGGTVSGNVDAAVYDEQGNRLVSAGSTIMSGTVALQIVDTTDTSLATGRYFMALACDNITARFGVYLPDLPMLRAAGVAQQATAFPLPASFTLAAVASAYLPVFGLEIGTLT